MDTAVTNAINAEYIKVLSAQNQLLFDDGRHTSQIGGLMNLVAVGQLLAGETMGYNTAARVPTTISQGDASGGIKAS